MVVYYLDTSAILKRYKTEKGTDVVDKLYASGLVNEAIEAARSHAVRAPDAIHVASASAVKQSVSEDFVFVSSDRELLSAARVSGLMTLDPESSDAMDTLKKLK